MSAVSTNITELPESRVRVEAQVAPEEIGRRIGEAARSLGAQLRIPGFRKGKVPPPVVIRRLGREAVLDEALRNSIGGWYADAIDASGISPIGEPDLDVGELPAQGQPLAFSIEIGVRPPAKLGRYRGLEVGRREPQADQARLEAELESLRDRFATLETAERPAEQGDHVVIDYLGRIGGEPFSGGEGRDQLLELGSGRLIPGFEEQLVGASAGEEQTVKVTFPADYAEHLAGLDAEFAVTVKEVKVKRLPSLDDDFASDAAGFETLGELRQDIAGRLREADERAVELEYERAVLDAVIAEAEIEVPAPLIHARAHELVGEMLHSLSHRGIAKEAYLQITGKDEEGLAHEAEPEAEIALKREAVLAALVQAEGIEPGEEDLLKALESSAEREKTTAVELLQRLQKADRVARLQEDVATRQALELLVREAKPVPIEATEPDQPPAA